MKDVLEDVDAWIARGDKVALATVIDVKRSAPRPPGREDGDQRARRDRPARCPAAASRARSSRSPRRCWPAAAPRLLHFGIADRRRGTSACRAAARSTSAWSATSRESSDCRPAVRASSLSGAHERARRGALVTVLAGAAPGAKLLVRADGSIEGTLGDAALDEAAAAPRRRADVGRALGAREEGDRAVRRRRRSRRRG